ncbi:unnamed protein product [Arctia plantaginis]|uniref:Uncharacterized protein n=1 Tax=Arctia plantaginis TaxID=874455 RepID=A0A8S1AP38_ARCPL|nr:unnamed protein product [Arctia plantaginis]
MTTVLFEQNEKNPALVKCDITFDVPVRLSEFDRKSVRVSHHLTLVHTEIAVPFSEMVARLQKPPKSENMYFVLGPFAISVKKWQSCKGPKAINMTTVLFEQNEKKPALVKCDITFDVPVRLSEIKIHVWHVEGLQKNILWNYKIDKPCQHFAVARWLSMYLHLQQNCIVKKGQYNVDLNLNTITKQFFGDSFFYGEFSFKSVVLSNQGNVMCLNYNIVISKKNSTKE